MARKVMPGGVRPGSRGGYVGRQRYTDEDGRSQRVEVYGRTEAEAWDKLRAAMGRVDVGEPATDSRRLLGPYCESYIAGPLAASERAAATRELYARLLRRHVLPALGKRPLREVRPSDVEAVFAAQRAAGMSGSTRRSTYAALRGLLDAAVADELLRANPCERVRRPVADSTRPEAYSAKQVEAVLAATSSHRTLSALVPLLLSTGLGRGEALGLLWSDVDLDARVLRVDRQLVRAGGVLSRSATKTAARARSLPLPAVVVEALRRHYAEQVADRLRAGAGWQHSGHVFATQLGGPLEPRNVSRAYAAALGPLGLHTGMHALRHTAATSMLSAGVDVRTVADVLGHASPMMTLEVYAHTNTDRMRAATTAAARALGGTS